MGKFFLALIAVAVTALIAACIFAALYVISRLVGGL
jgi:hypothetical protein